jgi:hypothetical protein
MLSREREGFVDFLRVNLGEGNGAPADLRRKKADETLSSTIREPRTVQPRSLAHWTRLVHGVAGRPSFALASQAHHRPGGLASARPVRCAQNERRALGN